MSEAPTILGFWAEVQRLAKPCEPSRYPDGDGNTVCMYHRGVMPSDARGAACSKVRPLLDPKLSAEEDPRQLGLFDSKEEPHG